jgi:hypothetical protein
VPRQTLFDRAKILREQGFSLRAIEHKFMPKAPGNGTAIYRLLLPAKIPIPKIKQIPPRKKKSQRRQSRSKPREPRPVLLAPKNGNFLRWAAGYAYIWKPEYHRQIWKYWAKRADVVLEEKLGRALARNEIAHHKNEVKSDDSPDNLEAKDAVVHSREHCLKVVKR